MLKAELIEKLKTVADDEPLFLLRAQDALAPKAINDWAGRAMASGNVPVGKINTALDVELQMADWQEKNAAKVKMPD